MFNMLSQWNDKNPLCFIHIVTMGGCIVYCLWQLFFFLSHYEKGIGEIRVQLAKVILDSNTPTPDKERLKNECGQCIFSILYKSRDKGIVQWEKHKKRPIDRRKVNLKKINDREASLVDNISAFVRDTRANLNKIDEKISSFYTNTVDEFIKDFYANFYDNDKTEEKLKSICDSIQTFANENDPFLVNKEKIWGWMFFAFIYILWVVRVKKGQESIWNIFDIGIYFTIVDFTDGFNIHLILSSGVIVGIISAILEARRIKRSLSSTTLSLRDRIKAYGSCILYVFIWAGLFINATIGHNYSWIEYVIRAVTIFVITALVWLLLLLISPFIKEYMLSVPPNGDSQF